MEDEAGFPTVTTPADDAETWKKADAERTLRHFRREAECRDYAWDRERARYLPNRSSDAA